MAVFFVVMITLPNSLVSNEWTLIFGTGEGSWNKEGSGSCLNSCLSTMLHLYRVISQSQVFTNVCGP